MMASESAVRLWADIQQNEDLWTIIPHFESMQRARSDHYDYVISSHKFGKSGRSDTRQSGHIHIGGGQQARLGNLRIAIRNGDNCVVRVSVYNELVLVGALTLDLPQQPH